MDERARQGAARAAETALIGGAGAALFVALHIPAGAILGSILATAGASLAGRRLGWPSQIRTVLLLVMGFGAGATATPDAIHAALLWPASIAVLMVATAVMWLGGWAVFRKVSATDSRTAFYASSPGALGTVLILAEQQEADLPKVAVAQSLRLLILVVLSPFALVAGHVAAPAPTTPPLIEGPMGWALLAAAVTGGWRLAKALKWPAAPFIGALLGSAALHVPGVVHAAAPGPVLMVAGAVLGAMIGSRFAGIRPSDVVRSLPACLSLVAVMAAIGVPVGIVVGQTIGVGATAGLMAFAPGSMEVMIAVSLSLNAHPAYVAAHHLCRTLLLLAVVPALSAYWARKAPGPA